MPGRAVSLAKGAQGCTISLSFRCQLPQMTRAIDESPVAIHDLLMREIDSQTFHAPNVKAGQELSDDQRPPRSLWHIPRRCCARTVTRSVIQTRRHLENRCLVLGGRHKRGLLHVKRLVQTEAGFTGVIVEHPDGLKRV